MDAARRIHASAIVVDTHVDLPYRLDKRWTDIGAKSDVGHFDIPRAREGGITAPFFSIYVPAEFAESGGAAKKALELIDLVNRLVDAHSGDLIRATSADDIRAAKKAGKIAVLTGLEGGHAIEDSLAALRIFHRLGVRYLTLTHSNTNHWADSSGRFSAPDYDAKKFRAHGGLNDFGREVVREMNRLGMIVDVSHVSDETVDDVLEVSRAPVIASHSSCRALADIPRNLTDDEIRRIAQKGGVVMINFGSVFVDQKAVDALRAAMSKLRPEYERIQREHKADPKRRAEETEKLYAKLDRRRADFRLVVDHVEHVMKVAGAGAVGLGSDFDGVDDPPRGLDDVSRLPALTEEFLRRGHSEEEVRKVLGENFLRVLEKVEETARGLAKEPPSGAKLGPQKAR